MIRWEQKEEEEQYPSYKSESGSLGCLENQSPHVKIPHPVCLGFFFFFLGGGVLFFVRCNCAEFTFGSGLLTMSVLNTSRLSAAAVAIFSPLSSLLLILPSNYRHCICTLTASHVEHLSELPLQHRVPLVQGLFKVLSLTLVSIRRRQY